MSYSLLFTREQVDKIKKLIYKTGSITPEIEFRLGGNITEQTLVYAKEVKAELVVIMTEQEVNFKSFFTGKFSEQFIKQADFPVLSVNTKDLILSEARL